MSRGILRTTLCSKVPLELTYREPSVLGEEETRQGDWEHENLEGFPADGNEASTPLDPVTVGKLEL